MGHALQLGTILWPTGSFFLPYQHGVLNRPPNHIASSIGVVVVVECDNQGERSNLTPRWGAFLTSET